MPYCQHYVASFLGALALVAALMAGASTATDPLPAPPFAALIANPPSAWAAERRACADGKSAPMLSSLATAETRTGVLRSPAFDAPPRLAFWIAGHSRQRANRARLVDAASGAVLRYEEVPGQDAAVARAWDLSAIRGRRVRLELVDGDDGTGWAWLAFGRLDPAVAPMPRGADVPDGWTETHDAPEPVTVNGIPFARRPLWAPTREGARAVLPVGARARWLLLLGCVNAPDSAGPDWGSGDSFVNQFIGDRLGAVELRYASGRVDRVPLTCGYTVWWRGPFQRSPAPFTTEPAARASLDAALCVANGLRPEGPAYWLGIALRGETLVSVTLQDDAARRGHVVFEGATLTDVSPTAFSNRLAPLPRGALDPAAAAWLVAHGVDATSPYPASRQAAVRALARSLYSCPADVTAAGLAAAPPRATAATYPGPRLRFLGPPLAELLTRVYYENASELLTRVDDATGMVHESRAGADNYGGFGGWTPGLGPFHADSYTRIRALTLLTQAGFRAKAEKAVDYYDGWMLYFPRAYPQVQLGGRPVPAHATVIANRPHVYFDSLRAAGWPTRYTTRDFGNPENDGHGLLLLTRWRAWVKAGRPREWVRSRWEAIDATAEYIPWCFEHPELSFSEHGLLYNESEGGMQKASIFCDEPCRLGLLACAEMADAVGRHDRARRWRAVAVRMRRAMEGYYPRAVARWGDVWDPDRSAGWAPGHAVLAPIVIGADYLGYDAARRLPAGWLARTERTYRMQMARNRPAWCAPTGLGYSQCYAAQAALLLDRMADAERLVGWMARLCFAPRLADPYRVPEGATVAGDGSVWRRWGDLGNLYQLAEVVYTVHEMAGIDDFSGPRPLFIPRLPPGWRGLEARGWPVRAHADGASVLARADVTLRRDKRERFCRLDIALSAPIDGCDARLGPFALTRTPGALAVNGRPVTANWTVEGDSRWARVRLGRGTRWRIAATTLDRAPRASVAGRAHGGR